MTDTHDPDQRDLEILLGDAFAALARDFDRHAAACRGRNYSEEGIPMLLILEDLGGDPPGAATGFSGDPALDLTLAAASEAYRRHLERGGRDLDADDIATVLEVLAARYLTLLPAADGDGA